MTNDPYNGASGRTSNNIIHEKADVYPINLMLSVGTAVQISVRQLITLKRISAVQTVYLDNSANLLPLYMSVKSTGQIVTLQPGYQGFFPLMCTADDVLTLNGSGSVGVVLANFFTPGSVWQSGGVSNIPGGETTEGIRPQRYGDAWQVSNNAGSNTTFTPFSNTSPPNATPGNCYVTGWDFSLYQASSTVPSPFTVELAFSRRGIIYQRSIWMTTTPTDYLISSVTGLNLAGTIGLTGEVVQLGINLDYPNFSGTFNATVFGGTMSDAN